MLPSKDYNEALKVIDALSRDPKILQQKNEILKRDKFGRSSERISPDQLALFLEGSRLPVHNEDGERANRHLALGRRHWLVFGSARGGDVVCRLDSLVISCKQAGVDPGAYLEDVINKVPSTKPSQMGSLAPWAWKVNTPRLA